MSPGFPELGLRQQAGGQQGVVLMRPGLRPLRPGLQLRPKAASWLRAASWRADSNAKLNHVSMHISLSVADGDGY